MTSSSLDDRHGVGDGDTYERVSLTARNGTNVSLQEPIDTAHNCRWRRVVNLRSLCVVVLLLTMCMMTILWRWSVVYDWHEHPADVSMFDIARTASARSPTSSDDITDDAAVDNRVVLDSPSRPLHNFTTHPIFAVVTLMSFDEEHCQLVHRLYRDLLRVDPHRYYNFVIMVAEDANISFMHSNFHCNDLYNHSDQVIPLSYQTYHHHQQPVGRVIFRFIPNIQVYLHLQNTRWMNILKQVGIMLCKKYFLLD